MVWAVRSAPRRGPARRAEARRMPRHRGRHRHRPRTCRAGPRGWAGRRRRHRCCSARCRAAALAEHRPQKTSSKPAPPPGPPAPAVNRAPPCAHRADRVVLLALLGVGQHGVGLADLLEPLLGLRRPRVLVRVQLARELAVGLLDRRGVRVLGDAEDRVEVLLEPVLAGHGVPPSRSGRWCLMDACRAAAGVPSLAGSRVGDRDAGRPDDPVAGTVAGLQHRDDRGRRRCPPASSACACISASCRHRVERLARLAEADQPELAEDRPRACRRWPRTVRSRGRRARGPRGCRRAPGAAPR